MSSLGYREQRQQQQLNSAVYWLHDCLSRKLTRMATSEERLL